MSKYWVYMIGRGEGSPRLRTIFCPPGPLPFKNASSNSESGGGFGRGGICFRIDWEPCNERAQGAWADLRRWLPLRWIIDRRAWSIVFLDGPSLPVRLQLRVDLFRNRGGRGSELDSRLDICQLPVHGCRADSQTISYHSSIRWMDQSAR
jgi:hypothetical protein